MERRKEQQLKYVSKALACECPENISDMFIIEWLIKIPRFRCTGTSSTFDHTFSVFLQ